MFTTRNLCFAFVFLMAVTMGHGQIVTTKKEGVKKGVYQKPSNTTTSEKDASTLVENTDKKAKKKAESKNNNNLKPVTSNLKNIISEENAEDIKLSEPENYLALQMINNAMEFLGVRYRGGGTSKSGMDCSGMVTAVYNLFDMSIPRSSRDMATVGQKVDTSEVKKGDLIFFKTNGRNAINHVGMVVDIIGDEIKFIHSSTSKGVIISSTKESYYKKAFAQVNRVLSNL